VGYGHLMRARALARCLGMEVSVSIRGGAAARKIAEELGPLAAASRDLDRADVVIVDDPSFAHGQSWIARARRRGIRTVSIHDDARTHAADLVVCASLGIRPRGRVALAGPRFYLLDSGIADARATRESTMSSFSPSVLIALGGGRHVRRLAQPMVSAIAAACPEAEVVVAAGFGRAPLPRLIGASWLDARGGLVPALTDADVAVVAGGVTLYEACALGVPSVALAVVPAQRRAIRAFARKGAVIDAGLASTSGRALEPAAAAVASLLRDHRLRQQTAFRASRLVDGRGAVRVARRIQALVASGRRAA
jgi:spore coat polysaccharide biosynthesis predicted glycosyltransferase SpsG